MMAPETFELEIGGGAAGLLVPGRVVRALAKGAGVPAEDIGVISPLRHGAVSVEIAGASAARLVTPRYVPTSEGQRPALFILRRADDAPDTGRLEILLEAPVGAPRATPGQVARALSGALGLGAEELGFGLEGAGFLRVTLPLRVARDLPASLDIGGAAHRIESLLKKP